MSLTSMLDREVYVYAEVDKLIGLPSGTAKRWINGYERNGKEHPPILRAAPKEGPWVTWGEFVEARMLAEYRDRKKVPILRQRGAIEELRARFNLKYPLCAFAAVPFGPRARPDDDGQGSWVAGYRGHDPHWAGIAW